MATKTQDMPPKGGYQKIEFKRIPARKYFSGYQMILGYIGKKIIPEYPLIIYCCKIFFRHHCRRQLPLRSKLLSSGARYHRNEIWPIRFVSTDNG